MGALSDRRYLSPSVNSRHLGVNTRHKFHNWRLVIVEAFGSSLLPALSLKMPPVIILPSLWCCHHPSATCHRKQPPRMYSEVRRPDLPGTSPLKQRGQATTSTFKSFSFICLMQAPVFALHSFLALGTVSKKTCPIIWGSILVSF